MRYRNLTTSDVEVKVEEETSEDDETTHYAEERIGYLVVEGDADGERRDGDLDEDEADGFGVEEFGTGGFGI